MPPFLSFVALFSVIEYTTSEIDRELASCTRTKLTTSSATERYRCRGTPGLGWLKTSGGQNELPHQVGFAKA